MHRHSFECSATVDTGVQSLSTEKISVHHVTTEDGTHTDKLRDIKHHRLLLAGDQLTVKRARSARSQRENSQHAHGKLRGFVPVAQDWHAGQCLLEVYTGNYK